MKKMTFFSSPIGLGHVTRDSAIVQHIEEISTKFVTGNAAAKFLEQLQFDVIDAYIPPQFIVENGLLQNPLRWLWNYFCKRYQKFFVKSVAFLTTDSV